ncbi:IPT/TIG domain-containing protein [Sphingobacterium sp. SYP-B4668]|uniref:IPT/TIG domain-containing protein n=1 Tax=Sphingobacterium sp. SYP-B4668 TaxID=2996035 RepID=UPI0022DD9DF6|nr:IPT/TIG domain-containing protein [Sphingobacterium sp. SYP-B4668]
MEKKNRIKPISWPIQVIIILLTTLCFIQCKEDSDKQTIGFDPSKQVVITDFYPKEGGVGSKLILYGENFGNDISKTKVVIGGKVAKVVGVQNNSVYCVIPEKAYAGDIRVSILDDEGKELVNVETKERFEYTKKLLVSTFLGKYYEVGSNFEEKEGPFNDCGAFKGMLWFSFDPKNSNHLYFSADYNSARLIDFEKQYVSYFRTGFDRVSVLNWRLDANQDMIVSHNQSSDTRYGNYLFSRESKFIQNNPIPVYARGVNGTIIHPQNGELYYSRFRAGDIRRYDFATGEDKLAFPNPYSAVAIYMVVHPSGDYAYLIQYDRHFIMRTDYDYARKTFTTPYTIAGAAGSSGYADGVGTNARLNNPVQGVFVKNPDYEQNGGDQYDFYFCDKENHAIRRMTPQGRISTFAGRGNNGTSGYADGDLRTEARFKQPQAIAYDEAKECFYIGDTGNWIIRKIAKEEEEEAVETTN